MPLFLWHAVGFAVFYAAYRGIATVPEEPNLTWWLTRPLWIVGPAALTLPLVAASKRIQAAT
jgi:hypothetical protein